MSYTKEEAERIAKYATVMVASYLFMNTGSKPDPASLEKIKNSSVADILERGSVDLSVKFYDEVQSTKKAKKN